MKNLPHPHLNHMLPADFLEEYWQKKPLVIKGAFPDIVNGISPEELAGLACEENVESRVVFLEREGKKWSAELGPFEPSYFENLDSKGWSVLIQDVDKFIPAYADLAQNFSFIPSWRFDDVMISYSKQGAGVGPHIDNYDVFIIQAKGTKTWKINSVPAIEDTYIEGLDLKIIDNFQPTDTWTLEPGDMIYLPPRVGHYGTTTSEDGMSVSVGFRGPTEAEFVSNFYSHFFSNKDLTLNYSDPELKHHESTGLIDSTAVQKIVDIIRRNQFTDEEIKQWMGGFVTEPKFQLDLDDTLDLNKKKLAQLLNNHEICIRDENTRIAYMASDELMLFIAGKRILQPGLDMDFCKLIADDRQVSTAALLKYLDRQDYTDFILQLFNHGTLYFDE